MNSESTPCANDGIPQTVQKTLQVCDFMTQLDICPKQFMVTFLSSHHKDIVYRRRLMKIGLAAKQTRSIVTNLGKLSKSCSQGKADWEGLILDEASYFVNAQELPRGQFPTGAYVSSSKITQDYFSDSADAIRETQVKRGMKFLYSLIHRKLDQAFRRSASADPEDDHQNADPDDSHTPIASALVDPVAEDEATVLSMENLICVKSSTAGQAAHRLEKVPIMVCAMIAVCCNRRSNAIPAANGLMAYAGGVSCRIHEWLHAHGMTTSRPTVLLALERLRLVQEEKMMEMFKINHKLLPLLCFDNVDIHLKIHNTRIEASSRMFHGTWGFFQVVRSCLLAKCEKDAVNLATFLDAMTKANRKAVQLSSFCPTPVEMELWVGVVKAQIASALQEYATYIPGVPKGNRISCLATHPSPVDPIEMHRPNIHFLRMMDAPDSSAAGVSRVLDHVMAQIGVEKEAYSENLLVAAGDVGSNQLVESLRVKRFPPIDQIEGLEWILSIFGGAHTTWNFTKSLLALHWGHTDKGDDSGAWRSLFALGAEYKKPVASQDFNTVMRSSQILHKANLVFIIGQVLEAHKELDLTKEPDCNKLLDLIWREYFDASSLATAKADNDPTKYNLMLRLRDFATVVEAHQATRAGDIGRLMLMWKRWAVMAQGVQGLSHYARHIPRIVLLLEEDLPESLAHVIKHSLLIPSNEREDHWLPLDEYLEINIFYLKDVYNNTGNGTDIEILIYRLSNNIAMLRKLMQLLKVHSGRSLIFQPNFNTISGPSLQAFLSYAKEHLGNKPSRRPSPAVTNVWHAGKRNMLKHIRADKAAGRSSRFRWGAQDVLSSSGEGENYHGEE